MTASTNVAGSREGEAFGPAMTPHGTLRRYNRLGCRCDVCRRGMARYNQERTYDAILGRPRTVPGTGTVRRVRALMAIGWPASELADRLGKGDRTQVTDILRRASHDAPVLRGTAEAISALYDELWDQPGPSAITRRRAAAKGWLPPLWFDDDRIDDPDYDPRDDVLPDEVSPRRERRDERLRRVERLTELGLSAEEIGERLGVDPRQVVRDRRDLRRTA